MPNLSPMELIMIVLVLAVLLAWILLIVRVIRVAWGGESARQVQELEARVKELEQKR
ncbi:hypothetical protein ACFP9V_02410 [Deinococcus radiopugnans]|uniref:Biopolymer transport protein ExbB/TolQ n=1 Tax=Deinococcus radiopugnans ATCC 19172 TaxID=585398 RepID=A0ABR6NLP0_9DEIO|nr:hypothetical protein [Deinococcus radiopugnans]MBB6014930.1 biopolymer transport protein ExbB/TolQ [Deinococcus radiopugnans ATCC 19172]